MPLNNGDVFAGYTANHTFAFRPPAIMMKGTGETRVNAELIRKARIAPAVHHNGLEAAG
jgi:hypothetical protein